MRSALSFWRCTRTARVLIPRSNNQAAWGSIVPPSVVRVEWMVSIRSRRPATIPQIRSECPAKYFVPECMTRSIPKSAGRWLMGVANVLSIKADEIVLPSQGSDLLQIDHAQCRIGRRLQIKQLRVWPDGARMLIVLGSIHKRGFDAEFWQPLAQELCSSAVNVTLGNHVVAALQQGEQSM